MRVEQRMCPPVEFDRAGLRIDSREEVSMCELELRIAFKKLAFQLELNNGDGLLHPRHLHRIAHSFAFHCEAFGGIISVNLSREPFERGDRNSVALLELRKPPVTQGEAQHTHLRA